MNAASAVIALSESTINPNQEENVKTAAAPADVSASNTTIPAPNGEGPATAGQTNSNSNSSSRYKQYRGVSSSISQNGKIAARLSKIHVPGDEARDFLAADQVCRKAEDALRALEGNADMGFSDALRGLRGKTSKLRLIAAYYDVSFADILSGTTGAYSKLASRFPEENAKAWVTLTEALKVLPGCPAQVTEVAHAVHQLATSVLNRFADREAADAVLVQARLSLRKAVDRANECRSLLIEVLRHRDRLNNGNLFAAIIP